MAGTNDFVLSLYNSQGITKTVEHLMTFDLDKSTNADSVRAKVKWTKKKHDDLKKKGRTLSHKAAVSDFLAQKFHLPVRVPDNSKSRKK